MNLEQGAIATVAVFLAGLAVALGRHMLDAARDRGARDEREKQAALRMGLLEVQSDKRYVELRARQDQQESGHNALDKALAIIGAQMQSLTSDVAEVKVAVGGLADKLEHTFRNIIAGKYGPPKT